MKNALILHGTDFSKSCNQRFNNWFPWLKSELEKRDYKVYLPELPQAWQPDIIRYRQFLKDKFDFNKDSLIFGHSSGATALLGILNKLPDGVKVNKSFIVAAFLKDRGWNCKGLFSVKFDWIKIKENSSKLYIIHSETDPYVPISDASKIAKNLEIDLINIKNGGHFNLEHGLKYKKFPYLLKLVDQ